MSGGFIDGILRADDEPKVIIPMPENPNKVVLASNKDIPDNYSLEVKIKKKVKNKSIPEREEYYHVTKVSIINEDLLEIVSVPGDIHASLTYLHLYDIENFNIKYVCDTDADGDIIDRKLSNINYKEES